MVDGFISAFDWLSPEWLVFLLAMLPLGELRIAIPVGLAMGMDPMATLFYALVGNFLPILPIVILLPKMFDWLYRFRIMQPFMDKVVNRAREKGKALERKGALGLILFVGIPLPGTGVWSGCLVSYLLGMRKRYAVVSIIIGMVLAGVLFTLSGTGLMKAFQVVADLEYILLAILIVVVAYYFISKKRKSRL